MMRDILNNQYNEICWDTESGLAPEALEQEVFDLEKRFENQSKSFIKAKTFELLLEKGQIAVLQEDIFQEKVNARDIMIRQRSRWWNEARENFNDMYEEVKKAMQTKTFSACEDFGHTSSNTKMLVNLGFCGLIKQLEEAESKIAHITEKQKDFYNSSKIVFSAMQSFCKRLSLAEGITEENARCLKNISEKAPSDFYEALQIIIVYFYLHEYIAGTRVRTLGRLDDVLYQIYRKDIDSGLLSRESSKEMLKYFLNKFWTMKVPYDLPFCLGGIRSNGEEITNELSYLIVEAYNELNIHSPKIHIRVSDKTPDSFIKLVLSCIRSGNSSFVFVNDAITIKAMMKCGATLEEARNYVLIG